MPMHLMHEMNTQRRANTQGPSASSRETTFPSILGVVIETRRKKLGLSQAEMAEKTGFSQPTLSRIERGGVPLTIPQLLTLAEVLGVAGSDLMKAAEADQRRLEANGVTVRRDAPRQASGDWSPLAGAALAGVLIGLALGAKGE